MSRVDQRFEELQAERDELVKGLESPFWARLKTALHGQLAARRNGLVATPINGLDAAFEAARLQAEVGALQLAIRLPEILLADVEADIKSALEAIREEEQNGEY